MAPSDQVLLSLHALRGESGRMPLTSRPEKGNIVSFGKTVRTSLLLPDTAPMPLSLTALLTSLPVPASWLESGFRFQFLFVVFFQDVDRKSDIYSILWVLVFGFATLNILGLVARRFEPSRNRLNFGETIAILVVVVSIVLLGWEMLNLFKIFPIKLHPHE
jgi:hypothetical protein